MQIIYSGSPVENAGGRDVVDPKSFREPLDGVSTVYYDGDNLKLIYGYQTRGVLVKPLSELPKSKAKTSTKGD